MNLGLKGKIALVTGSSRGIGRGIALALAGEGCDVMLTGRDRAALDDTAAAIGKLGCRAAIAVIDLRDKDAPAKLIEQVKREFGGLDILVNNAGATKRGDFLNLTDADWEDGSRLNSSPMCGSPALPGRFEGAARCARFDRRHRRTQADRRIHDRQFGQRRGRRLHQMSCRSWQDRWRARELHPSKRCRNRPDPPAHQS